ncbi:DotU family type IV/VI secretion system protein [Bradyrhizobium lablabi]|nr:DotU family type IV/VI secretion system protein [Bradyrhizobium lablabi]
MFHTCLTRGFHGRARPSDGARRDPVDRRRLLRQQHDGRAERAVSGRRDGLAGLDPRRGRDRSMGVQLMDVGPHAGGVIALVYLAALIVMLVGVYWVFR